MRQVLWVSFHKLHRLVPKRRNGGIVLGKREREAIRFVVHLHEQKGVKVNITHQINTRLHSPVVLEA